MSTLGFEPKPDDLRKELIKERNKRFKVEERIKQIQTEIQIRRASLNKEGNTNPILQNDTKIEQDKSELLALKTIEDDINEVLLNEDQLSHKLSNQEETVSHQSNNESLKGINRLDILLKENKELKENIEKITASYKLLSHNYSQLSNVNSKLIKDIEALSQIIKELKEHLISKDEMIKSLLLEKKESLIKNDRFYFILEEKITLQNQLDEREQFCEEKNNQILAIDKENREFEEKIKETEVKLGELDIMMNKMAYELYDMKKQIMNDYTHEFNVYRINMSSSNKEECTIGVKIHGKDKILHVGTSDKIYRYIDDKVSSVETLESINQFIVKYENGSFDTFESAQRDEIVECIKKQFLNK